MAITERVDIQCFISYHRPDNEVFDGVVDRMKSDISGRFAAETGRQLRIFVDRDDIPGGGDWRARIGSAIAAATVFVPVITQRYFQSEACREELIAFFDGADSLGVTDLILPVILAGRDGIRRDDPRPEVRIIERLNYRWIGEAVDAGYQSSEWKSAMRRLVEDLAKGILRAEVSIERPTASRDDASRLGVQPEELAALGDELVRSLAVLEAFAGALEGFGPEEFLRAPTSEHASILSKRAEELAPAAQELERVYGGLETSARELDQRLRGGPNTGDEWTQIPGIFGELLSAETESDARLDVALDATLENIQRLGVQSVAVRKSLEPAMRGLRSQQNVLSIIRSWRDFAESA